jgi:hypothetical protein
MKKSNLLFLILISFCSLFPAVLLAQNMEWTCATNSAGWSGRRGHTSVVFDNKMWVLGGWDTIFGSRGCRNDVWYSTDGINWTQATDSAGWSPRWGHTSVVFDNKMWVLGGGYNDVWYSSDGVNWIEATDSAGWSGRYGHTSVVFYNKIWVIGGWSTVSPYYRNDVWFSSDGVNWTCVTASARWSPRAWHTSVVFDNKIWVLGGLDLYGLYSNDVWYSTDGINWTQAGLAGWSGRAWHTSVVFDNKIWVLGGDDGYINRNDVWYSMAGVNWVQTTSSSRWSPRIRHTSVVFDNKIWVMGGMDTIRFKNDVWYSGGFIHDVGVAQIISPNNSIIDSGTVIIPQVKIKNFGIFMESFPVIFKISTFYADTLAITNLRSGDSMLLDFHTWEALQRGVNIVKCTTALVADSNPSNDAMNGSVTVRVRDAGAASILSPTGIIDSGTVFIPQATVQNFGTVSGTFWTKFRIGTSYEDFSFVTLLPGQIDTVEFLPWTANRIGTLATKCTTCLANDMNPSNDFVEDSVIVQVVGMNETKNGDLLKKVISNQVMIYNFLGEKVQSKYLPSGVYFIRDLKSNVVKKFVVVK